MSARKPVDAIYPLRGVLAKVRAAAPANRVALASDIYQQLAEVQQLIVAERRSAVREMREQGMTLNEIAVKLGVSISRVKQMEEGPRREPIPAERKVAKLQRQLERAQAEQEAS